MGGWGRGGLGFCVITPVVLHPKAVSFGSTETPKPAVLLFCETTETNLFVSDSVEKNSFRF
jgi:hypothetical protein